MASEFTGEVNWKREDFFKLEPAQIHSLKTSLASICGVNYANAMTTAPIGKATSGIQPMTASCLEELATKLKSIQGNTLMSCAAKDAQIAKECVFATVVSGCHIRWATTGVLNTGYILSEGMEFVASWDTAVERRAGGYDYECQPSAQEFACTNMSSLMALFAEVVYHFKHKSLTDQLKTALASIRVTVYLAASVDEISNINVSENVAQHKRKVHTELDNLKLVQSWMSNMRVHQCLDAGKSLDVYKYAIALRDPRAPLPDWLAKLLKNGSTSMKATRRPRRPCPNA